MILKLLLTTFLSLLFSFTALAQPVLFDEFGNVPDDEFGARVQNLYVELGQKGGRGIIAISAPEKLPFLRKVNELRCREAIEGFKLDPRRVSFKFIQLPKDEMTIQVWHVPDGSTPPELLTVEDDLRMGKLEKQRFVFATCVGCYDGGFLSDFFDLYRRILLANPSVNARIEIAAKSPRAIRRAVIRYRRLLLADDGIKKNRLQFVRSVQTAETLMESDVFFIVSASRPGKNWQR